MQSRHQRWAQPGITLLGLTALFGAACGDQADGNYPVTELAPGIFVDLGEGTVDPAVEQDALRLIGDSPFDLDVFDPEAGHEIRIIYLGQGRLGGPSNPEAPVEEAAIEEIYEAPEGFAEMDGINLATRNEFRIQVSSDYLAALGERDHELGLDQGSPAYEETPDPEVERPAIELPSQPGLAFSLSNGTDGRYLPFGTNGAVTSAAARRTANMGGCTGAMVGPRHVVTAGHCLWDRGDAEWSVASSIQTGRNGTSWIGNVSLNPGTVPGDQVLWYFTPTGFRNAASSLGFDYGILTIPARLGEASGWMGRATLSGSGFSSNTIRRRGYPTCNATTSSGVPRVDEPCSDDGPAGEQACTCRNNSQYLVAGGCSIGEYTTQDSSGWSRVIHHSCDASGGDSGSPLYYSNSNGTPVVAAVHVASLCETVAVGASGYVACTGTRVDRPLRATRLTPEYRDWIAYFLNRFP